MRISLADCTRHRLPEHAYCASPICFMNSPLSQNGLEVDSPALVPGHFCSSARAGGARTNAPSNAALEIRAMRLETVMASFLVVWVLRLRPAEAGMAAMPASVIADSGHGEGSGSDESEQVGVDGLGLRGGHSVREALVGLQRPVLQQLRRERRGVGVGDDLIVVAVHDQHRNRDPLQVLGEVCLREGDDAVVVRLAAAHHALAPPVLDYGLRAFHPWSIEAIKRPRRDVAVEL